MQPKKSEYDFYDHLPPSVWPLELNRLFLQLGTLEIRDSAYIFAKLFTVSGVHFGWKLQKDTYTYISLWFSGKMNTKGSKTATTFNTKYNNGANCQYI